MTYFQALYFCYVSLLTIGYGDLSPKSNAGRCFFVVWSLVAVPTMTILISDMGDTIISNFKRGTFALADFTVLPKEASGATISTATPGCSTGCRPASPPAPPGAASSAASQRTGPESLDGLANDTDEEDAEDAGPRNIDTLAVEAEADAAGRVPDDAELSRQLALAIRRVASDLKLEATNRYSYEEWVEFTRLIRFTRKSGPEVVVKEEERASWSGLDWER